MTATTATRPVPTIQQIINLIENETYYLAKNDTPQFRLVHRDANTLRLSDSGTITLNPDGTLSMTGSINHVRIHMHPREHGNFFYAAWMEPFHDAERKILDQLMNMLQANYPKYEDPEKQPYQEQRRLLLEYKSVEKAIAKAAMGIRSTVGLGYLQHPARLGYGVLHDFLGKDRVSRALRIAGAHATLHQFNTIAHNLQAFEEAHRLNPNATVLFFQLYPYRINDVSELFPQQIINWAKTYYQRNANPNPDSPDDSWPTFCNLNHRAINSHPSRKAEIYARIAKLTQQAGVYPSHTAVSSLLKLGNILNIPDPLLIAFITESDARTRDRKKTQAQLARQMENTIEFLTHDYDRTFKNTIRALPDNTPWDAIMETLPAQIRDTPPPAKKARKHTDRPNRPITRKTTTTTLVRTIVNGPAMSQLKVLLEEPLTLRSDASAVTLTPKDSQDPVFRATRLQNKTIHIDAPSYWHTGLDLPNPELMGTPDPSWTTRGAAMETATRIAYKYMTENWATLSPEPNLPTPTQNRVASAVEHLVSSTDHHLSLQLADALRSLIDPTAMEETRKFTSHVTLHNYNITAAIGHQMDHLMTSNPGALQWALHHVAIHDALNHPGQVITAAKETLVEAGLHPRNWKFAATLDGPVMRELCLNTESEHQAALLLNAMAQTRSVPTPNVLAYAQDKIPRLLTDVDPGLRRDNSLSMITLMFKENHDNPDPTSDNRLTNQAIQVMDYVRNLNAEQQPVRATTWKGLMRASDKWHKTLRHRHITERWINLLEQQHNHYQAWDSALKTTQVEDYTAVPLNTEHQLYQDSLAMHHCVIGYGPNCAQGDSRIFSLLKDSKPAATTEIQFMEGAWQPVQTRGYYNAQVSPDLLTAAERVADAYNKAQNRPQRHRSSWYVNNVTKETTTTLPGAAADQEYAVAR